MIAIVDYGLGNVQALGNIFHRLGVAYSLAKTPGQLRAADRILLPGVGSFDWAMSRLDASGMRESLDEMVLDRRTPVLGICVGMQMMAHRSDEGSAPGLGWIDAEVRKLQGVTREGRTFLPHMGWNEATPVKDTGTGLFRDFTPNERFYFLHSYFIAPKHKEDVLAETDYGGNFASAVHSGNIYGVQFHPEKSHAAGTRLLKNFSEG